MMFNEELLDVYWDVCEVWSGGVLELITYERVRYNHIKFQENYSNKQENKVMFGFGKIHERVKRKNKIK